MKKTYFITFLIITLITNNSFAQRAACGKGCVALLGMIMDGTNCTYQCYSMGIGDFFLPTTNDKLQISFPYTSTNQSGILTNYTFTSKQIEPFSNQLYSLDMNWECGNLKHFFTTQCLLVNGVTNISAGYGYNFYFNRIKYNDNEKEGRYNLNRLKQNQSEVMFKLSLNLVYNNFSGSGTDNLGNIDNENQTINILGIESDPTFTTEEKESKYSKPKTVVHEAKSIDIGYDQNDWLIMPRIGISSNPMKHIFHWEFDLSYNFPFSEKEGLSLSRNDELSESDQLSGLISVKKGIYTTTLKNKIITTNPYKFYDFSMGLTIGFSLDNKFEPHNNRQHL